MVKRLISAVIYCVVILTIAWALTVILALLPVPGVATLATVIWVLGVVCCLIVLLRLFSDVLPDAP